MTGNNEIWIDGRAVAPEGVRAAIERIAAENPEGGVVIQADNGAYNEYVITVMDAAKAAGVASDHACGRSAVGRGGSLDRGENWASGGAFAFRSTHA